MIDRLDPPRAWTFPGPPMMLSKERARIDCGCCVYITMRVDNREAGSNTSSCSPEHRPMLEEFNDRWKKSIEEAPQPRPAVEVAEEMLMEVAASYV